MEWARELRTRLLINNFEYIAQSDEVRNHSTELILDDVFALISYGAAELATIKANENATEALNIERDATPQDQINVARYDATINGKINVLELDSINQATIAGCCLKIEKAASYLMHILQHNTKTGSEINSYHQAQFYLRTYFS